MGWFPICYENCRSNRLRGKMAMSSKWHPILEAMFPYFYKTSRSQSAIDRLSGTIQVCYTQVKLERNPSAN